MRLVNLYGPTEATVDVSDHECASDNPTRVPIGRPIDNLRLYVLDRALRPQPLGAVGGYIGGVGVARGYLNRPELNAERFLADPSSPAAVSTVPATWPAGWPTATSNTSAAPTTR